VIRGSTSKAYLVPIEQPPPGTAAGLSLSFTPLRDQEVLDTPVGKLAIVISKDAWMVDVNDRFVAKGANVVLQPEAFDSWAFTTTEWSPDVFGEGGRANVQKNPEWVVNVDPDLSGNLFDITFDGQSSIIGRKRKGPAGPLDGTNAWIGQNPDTSLLAVGPWIAPDPGIANPSMTLAARRAALVADGALLKPGSGIPARRRSPSARARTATARASSGPTSTSRRRRRRARPTSRAPCRLASAPPCRASGPEATPVVQHAPRIAARGRHVYVVWSQDDGAGSSIHLAASHDSGQTFDPPIKVSDNLPGSVTSSIRRSRCAAARCSSPGRSSRASATTTRAAS
jgi:hypothetical protein